MTWLLTIWTCGDNVVTISALLQWITLTLPGAAVLADTASGFLMFDCPQDSTPVAHRDSHPYKTRASIGVNWSKRRHITAKRRHIKLICLRLPTLPAFPANNFPHTCD